MAELRFKKGRIQEAAAPNIREFKLCTAHRTIFVLEPGHGLIAEREQPRCRGDGLQQDLPQPVPGFRKNLEKNKGASGVRFSSDFVFRVVLCTPGVRLLLKTWD